MSGSWSGWIEEHWKRVAVVIGCAFFIGFVTLLPHLLITRVLDAKGETYTPYTLRGSYDFANVIAPRLHEVLEGHFFISDTDLFEYKHAPAFLPMGSESYAAFVSPFTNSVAGVVEITDFVFPSLFFVLLFFLSLLLTKRNFKVSLFSALLVSLYVEIAIHIPPPSLEFVKVFWHTVNPFTHDPNSYFLTRRQSFIPGLLPVLLTFLFLLLTLQSTRTRYAILGGFSFAAIAYTYPYHFLYVSSTCGIVFLFILFSREYPVAKRLLFLGGVAFVCMIPFLCNYFAMTHLPQYQEIFARFGSMPGRHLNTDNWKRYVLCVIAAVMIWKWGKSTSSRMPSIFIVATLLSGIVVLNLQALFGFSIQPDHWLNRDIVWAFSFAYIALLGWGLQYIASRYSPWVMRGVGVVGVVLLLGITTNNVRTTVRAAAHPERDYVLSSQDKTLFDWLNTHTKPEDVVMTPSLVRNSYIPMYTHDNIFIPQALNTIAPDNEIVGRLFITYRIFGISPSFLRRMLVSDSAALPYDEGIQMAPDTDEYYETAGSLYLFALKYSQQLPAVDVAKNSRLKMPYATADSFVSAFKDYHCDATCFSKYRVDYVVMGTREKMLTNVSLDTNPYLRRVGTGDGWIVYKVQSQ